MIGCLIGCGIAPKEKPIHGEKIPIWKRLGLQEFPPVWCAFAVGDSVVFRNSYGEEFDAFVIGFSEAPDTKLRGGFIHIATRADDESGSAWWYPHQERELRASCQGLLDSSEKQATP